MNKFLKLTGVSMLAIVAATNANAAGYTCEELVEYTSCNDGYALSMAECVDIPTCSVGNYSTPSCPDGYELEVAVCLDKNGVLHSAIDSNDCVSGYNGTFSDYACSSDSGNYEPVVYACESCPSTGLVDPNNNPILATTNTGATSVAECYVKPGVDIKGEHGTYHFKSNCTYLYTFTWKTPVTSPSDCEMVANITGYEWEWSYFDGSPAEDFIGCHLIDMENVDIQSYMPQTQSECEEMSAISNGDLEWRDGICISNCDYMYFGPNGMQCSMI